jgi:hypothetical protein
MEINFDDSFLEDREFKIVHDYCLNASYRYGESDNGDGIVTGMVHEIPETEFVYKLFRKKLMDKCPFLSKMKLYRTYVNCFSPNENPYFHTDGEGITFLYYVNDQWDIQDGGETQFYVDGNIYGITPVPNRLVMFHGMIPHRATSFRYGHRFTIAIKYAPQ